MDIFYENDATPVLFSMELLSVAEASVSVVCVVGTLLQLSNLLSSSHHTLVPIDLCRTFRRTIRQLHGAWRSAGQLGD